MKRIFIAILWCSLAINAMEQEKTSTHNNDNPLYIGIVTHILREATYEGKLSMVTCERNMSVHEYSGDNKFELLEEITEKYLTSEAKIRTPSLPNPNPIYYSASSVKFSDFKPDTQDVSKMITDIKLVITKKILRLHSYASSRNGVEDLCSHKENSYNFNLEMGHAVSFDLEKSIQPSTRSTLPAVFDQNGSYLPGLTHNILKLYDETAGPVDLNTNVTCRESIDPSIYETTQLLKTPGPRPASLLIACLKLQKQNGKYVPVPTEVTRIAWPTEKKD